MDSQAEQQQLPVPGCWVGGTPALVQSRRCGTHIVQRLSSLRGAGEFDRARALGWQDFDVIDSDLGISGSGVGRPALERLLAAVCDGQAGVPHCFSTGINLAASLHWMAAFGDENALTGPRNRLDQDIMDQFLVTWRER